MRYNKLQKRHRTWHNHHGQDSQEYAEAAERQEVHKTLLNTGKIGTECGAQVNYKTWILGENMEIQAKLMLTPLTIYWVNYFRFWGTYKLHYMFFYFE